VLVLVDEVIVDVKLGAVALIIAALVVEPYRRDRGITVALDEFEFVFTKE
jgi:hypothetical protein